jgi:hypothetical protein
MMFPFTLEILLRVLLESHLATLRTEVIGLPHVF